MLKEYEQLLDAYKRLKTGHGEDAERGSGYVLVLVDGNGYFVGRLLIEAHSCLMKTHSIVLLRNNLKRSHSALTLNSSTTS